MWQQLVKEIRPECRFFAPANKFDISAVETALKVSLPEELAEILGESNGVHGDYGLGLIWPLEQIRTDNLRFRKDPEFKNLYMPFDNLLFFGDAGNGDQFAYSICNGVIRRPDIFVWNHENDSREWVAPSLKKYLEWWLTGQINI
jgi:hypothetical protein